MKVRLGIFVLIQTRTDCNALQEVVSSFAVIEEELLLVLTGFFPRLSEIIENVSLLPCRLSKVTE